MKNKLIIDLTKDSDEEPPNKRQNINDNNIDLTQEQVVINKPLKTLNELENILQQPGKTFNFRFA